MTYKCVLVIEDDNDVCLLIKKTLETKGYVVFVAENGQEALQKLDILNAVYKPCLILCDLNMPVMDGWKFIEAIGKISKIVTIPLVIHSSEDVLPGGHESLDKPTILTDLLKTVEKHCGKTLPDPIVVGLRPLIK